MVGLRMRSRRIGKLPRVVMLIVVLVFTVGLPASATRSGNHHHPKLVHHHHADPVHHHHADPVRHHHADPVHHYHTTVSNQRPAPS